MGHVTGVAEERTRQDGHMDAAQQLARIAHERGLRIAVAESLTSGLLASAVGSGEHADDWFCRGAVAYRTDSKQRVLGVDAGIDPCSAACAEQMAHGARVLFEADIAVSTTGIGGPDPQDGHAPGTVYVGWATADGTGHRLFHLDGTPEEVLAESVDLAVQRLRELAEP